MDMHVGNVDFNDGVCRTAYQDAPGRQYLIDDAGEPVFGAWLIPEDEPQPCAIVDYPSSRI